MKFDIQGSGEDRYRASIVRADGVFCPGWEHTNTFGCDLDLGDHQLDDFAGDVRATILGIVDSQEPLPDVLEQESLRESGERLFAMAAIAALRLADGEDLRVDITAMASHGERGLPGGWPRNARIYVIRLIGGEGTIRFAVIAYGPQMRDPADWRFELEGRRLIHASPITSVTPVD
jgi:hypothetical protein